MNAYPEVVNTKDLIKYIRKIPNWPKPGILFHDITTLLQNPILFRLCVDSMVYRYINQNINIIAGIDARGFIIGSALAYQLNIGFVPIRKKGKLPFTTISESYALEYGSDIVEIHTDAIKTGDRVLIVDDLIATGNTMQAGINLIKKLNGHVVEAASIIEFTDLIGGSNIREQGTPVFSLCHSLSDVSSYELNINH